MKFTSKKTVSEVILDFEDGCIIKLTKGNIEEISMSGFDRYFWVVIITLKNGLSFNIKVDNCSELLNELTMLVNC